MADAHSYLKKKSYVTKASQSFLSFSKKNAAISLSDCGEFVVIDEGGDQLKIAVQSIRRVVVKESDRHLTIEAGKKAYKYEFIDPHELKQWHEGLTTLVHAAHKDAIEDSSVSHAKATWKLIDKDADGVLTMNEIKVVLESLCIDPENRACLAGLFTKYDTDNSGTLDFNEFIKFFREIGPTDPFTKKIFTQYGGADGTMSLNELEEFLMLEQKVPKASVPGAAGEVMKKFGSQGEDGEWKLSFPDFAGYLYSTYNLYADPEKTSKVYMDMTKPLAHYFIASSHNTYLEGNQLTGDASEFMYKTTILNGARCVELDVWDGDDGVPSITHGHTLTGTLKFEDAIKILPDCAFKTSEYPFILSIENHCSPEQTGKMADIMIKHLGANIVCASKIDKPMPSPEALKRKYLIKAKVKKGTTPENYANLVYLQGTHFENLDVSQNNAWNKIQSFSENKLEAIIKEDEHAMRKKFVAYNKTHLSRTYPMGTRIDSSNYDPTLAWELGCQIVALNYQSCGTALMSYDAMFAQNGGCGYVLKPDYALEDNITLSPTVITVRVILSHNCPPPKESSPLRAQFFKATNRVSVYVSLGATACVDGGIDLDDRHTESVSGNEVNPVYPNNIFTFKTYKKDLCNIVFKLRYNVTAGKDITIALGAIPVSLIRPGYRIVPLRDTNFVKLPPYIHLLCHFDIQ